MGTVSIHKAGPGDSPCVGLGFTLKLEPPPWKTPSHGTSLLPGQRQRITRYNGTSAAPPLTPGRRAPAQHPSSRPLRPARAGRVRSQTAHWVDWAPDLRGIPGFRHEPRHLLVLQTRCHLPEPPPPTTFRSNCFLADAGWTQRR